MKRRSILVWAMMLCLSGTSYGALTVMTIGDDDGFGSGTPMVAGDNIWTWASGDGDGTDRYIVGASEGMSYTFTYHKIKESFLSASLFVQYTDWPETGGHLWLDGVQTDYVFTDLYPWQQVAPWTVLNSNINLNSYAYLLTDGSATFKFIGSQTDGYAIDFLTLTIDIVPVPSAVFLGSIGIGVVNWLRRRKTI